MFWAQSTTRDYIRAEGDFYKEIHSWKDQEGRDETRKREWENRELFGEVMAWNTVERAKETEIDTRTEYTGVGKLSWFMSGINCNIPTMWRWACGDLPYGRNWIMQPFQTRAVLPNKVGTYCAVREIRLAHGHAWSLQTFFFLGVVVGLLSLVNIFFWFCFVQMLRLSRNSKIWGYQLSYT